MQQLNEYFSPTKLAELNTKSEGHYGGMARQELEVYSKQEALAKLAEMLEDLKQVSKKAEAIQEFAKENGLEDMVSFCCWSDAQWELDKMVQADVESDAMQWMRSNHNC
ncbi:hypothetical protein QGX17_gp079 [Pseudomonas phage phiPsa381]|uniref:Uncharacterized protein n=1 Tax=Pseudomonas phage phiPsa381 TaxID=1460366 RepID=A0A7G9V2Y7_9CAUD|nr:hypothetical protein QGX17_gp079 [Pseudomonas phage phiPsa381]QNO00643.1 hypothetical protein phiPsa381_145 [Pseudomonas phage phiPsa381]